MSLYGHRAVFYNHHPLLASCDFQGSRGLKQKRKLSPGPDASGRKPDPVTRARHTYDPETTAPYSEAGPGRSGHRSRNYYRVPFRHCIPALPRLFHNCCCCLLIYVYTEDRSVTLFERLRNTWDTGSLSLGSGLTHPCSTDVDMEPFSTSANEALS